MLHWKHGNLFEKAKALRIKQQDAQNEVENDPFNKENRCYAVSILEEYTAVSNDELKLLHQKVAFGGDKNTSYFHSILKTRKHKSRVDSICNDKGSRYWGDDVAKQIVKNFQEFLGVKRHVVPLEQLRDIMQLKLSEEDANAMIVDVIDKEIKDAMFDIDSTKASGWIHFLIKIGLYKVVSINQRTFIPRRHIQDNILLTQELLKGYNKKQGAKRYAMKIDLQKAYDTVNWKFPEEEVQISLWLQGIEAHRPMLADDLLVLCNGDVDSLRVVKESLEEFNMVSGLFPNQRKTSIFFGSIMENKKNELLEIMPFKFGKLPMKYLGVPLLAKRLGINDCKEIIDNVTRRINSWRNKKLSYGGRIQLIASVLSSMQHYWALVYMLPITAVKELDKLFKRFLWNSGDSAKGKARVAWNIWCSMGPLDRFFTKRDIYEARIEDDAKIADLIYNSRWKWPEEWATDHPELLLIPVSCLNEQTKDKVYWVDVNKKEYNPSYTDSYAHLFFTCPLASKIWDRLKVKGNLHNFQNCLDNVVSIIAAKPLKNSVWSILQKLLVASVVYHLWQERNKMLFQNESRSVDILSCCIEGDVENKLKTLIVRNSSAVIDVARVWDLT
ncbi:hypothetical protein Tco_0516638 [Tanacetum coccineum]